MKIKHFFLKDAFLAGFIITFFLVLSASCATKPAVKETRIGVYLTDRSRFFLLPPDGIEKPLDMAQFLSISYRGMNFFCNAWVYADKNGMDIVMFNDLGASMAELSYKNGSVDYSSGVLPQALKPEYIIADFQLCFYDPLLLSRALEECSLFFEAQDHFRRIYMRSGIRGRKLIIEITKTPGVIKIENHLRGYAYTLEGDFE